MSEYYCLVAGLPDIVFDGSKINYSIERFKEEIYASLTKEDAARIDLFFYAWDNENIIEILRNGADANLSRLGRYSHEELAELIAAAKSGDARTADYPA